MSTASAGIENLTDEILENILLHLSPYQDLTNCMLVSRRWNECSRNVIRARLRNFESALKDPRQKMTTITPGEMNPEPTTQYGHAAVVHGNFLYLYGGSTDLNIENEFWKLDLTKREWTRLRPTGWIPMERTHSTLVSYKDQLVLFGGAELIENTRHDFNDLYIYDVRSNRWSLVTTSTTPPAMSYHSASVVGEWMVVIGGRRSRGHVDPNQSRTIWKFNLESREWYAEEVQGDGVPGPRVAHSQMLVNRWNILLMGGTDLCDITKSAQIWILRMSDNGWRWHPVEIREAQNQPTSLRRHACSKVGRYAVALFRIHQEHRPNIMCKPQRVNLYVLDLKDATQDLPSVTWLPHKILQTAPREVPRYNTFVTGRSELIMFGGVIETNWNSMEEERYNRTVICDRLRFISRQNETV